MHKNITKQASWLAILTYIVLLFIIIYRSATGNNAQPDALSISPLGRLFNMIDISKTLHLILSGTVITISGVLTMQLISKYGLALIYAPIPLVFYLVIGYAIAPQYDLLRSGILSLLMIWALYKFIPIFQRDSSMQNIFTGNFIIGIITMFYPAAMPFTLVFCIMAASFRYSFSALILSLGGFFTALLLTSWGWWLAGEPFFYVIDSITEILFKSSHFSIIDLMVSDYFLHSALLLGFLVCMIRFIYIKKTISFTLLITAKYAQDCLVILFIVSIIELGLNWADGAIFPLMGVICAPLMYQLYSKQRGNFAIISYLYIIILAISGYMI